MWIIFLFCKQKTADERRICDWTAYVCSSDLDTEYVYAIQEGVAWLGFKWNALLYASDYFERLYGFGVTLIQRGLAYVDSLNADEIRQYRGAERQYALSGQRESV